MSCRPRCRRWESVWESRDAYDRIRRATAQDFAFHEPYHKKHRVAVATALGDQPDPIWARNVALYYSSFVNERVHDPAKALRYARAAAARLPDDPGILEALACALARSGDFKAAVETQERAIRLYKESDGDEQIKACSISRLESELKLFGGGKPYQGEQ